MQGRAHGKSLAILVNLKRVSFSKLEYRRTMTTDYTSAPAADQASTDHILAELWREVLQSADLPVPTDNFFALGGDSMAMVMLEFRIREEFSVELPAGVVLGAPTLSELSALIDAECVASQVTRTAEPGATSEALE